MVLAPVAAWYSYRVQPVSISFCEHVVFWQKQCVVAFLFEVLRTKAGYDWHACSHPAYVFAPAFLKGRHQAFVPAAPTRVAVLGALCVSSMGSKMGLPGLALAHSSELSGSRHVPEAESTLSSPLQAFSVIFVQLSSPLYMYVSEACMSLHLTHDWFLSMSCLMAARESCLSQSSCVRLRQIPSHSAACVVLFSHVFSTVQYPFVHSSLPHSASVVLLGSEQTPLVHFLVAVLNTGAFVGQDLHWPSLSIFSSLWQSACVRSRHFSVLVSNTGASVGQDSHRPSLNIFPSLWQSSFVRFLQLRTVHVAGVQERDCDCVHAFFVVQ